MDLLIPSLGFCDGVVRSEDAVCPTVDDKPSLFTAIQEQLGLKLEALRGRAEVWIIDAASPPRQD
jgi:uncharacterized protein (TIGR03435 family)